jgi:hypothetical protein
VTLTEASPVSIPTLAAPNTPYSAKNFSLTSALIGAVIRKAHWHAYVLNRPATEALLLTVPLSYE